MRNLFPFFDDNNDVVDAVSKPVYLDSAATSQKLRSVIDATTHFYTHHYATVNRSTYPLAQHASTLYEQSRERIASLINANHSNEIVFTSGATHSINLVANGLKATSLQGNTVLVLASEHHANLIPWQVYCRQHGLSLEIFHLDSLGRFDTHTKKRLMARIKPNIAIIAIAHVSNLLGNIYPVKEICHLARVYNVISVIDGTQAAAHLKVDVQDIDCDFYALSLHKMYGPNGVGALFAKTQKLEELEPSSFGGEMVSDVSFDSFDVLSSPLKLETGTGNLAGIIASSPAVAFLEDQITNIVAHERDLFIYALARFAKFESIEILGNAGLAIENITKGIEVNLECASIISFYHKHIDSMDLANALYQQNIAVRAGTHCAMPMMKALGIENCVRLSLGCYNNEQDLDAFFVALSKAISLTQSSEVIAENLSQTVDENTCGREDESVNSQELPIAKRIKAARNWDNKHRELLLASKALIRLEQNECNQSNYVAGCEANVWLAYDSTYRASASSKVVRGLMTVLLEKANDLSLHEIAPFDFDAYLNDLGLADYFSQGRKDGIGNAIKRIKILAKQS